MYMVSLDFSFFVRNLWLGLALKFFLNLLSLVSYQQCDNIPDSIFEDENEDVDMHHLYKLGIGQNWWVPGPGSSTGGGVKTFLRKKGAEWFFRDKKEVKTSFEKIGADNFNLIVNFTENFEKLGNF